MKLRWKTLLIIGITVISVLLLLLFVSNLLMLNGVGAIEQKDTRREAEIVVDSVEHELEDLDATTADYAAWDDTYTFVQDGNLDYINLNLMDATFVNLRLNIMLFVNSTNQVVFGKAFDLQNETEMPFPQSLTQHLVDNDLLLSHNTTASSMKGAIAIVEGPLLIASRPILTSQREGPIRGTLITGRFLDSVEMSRLYHVVHLPLVLQIMGHPWISSDFQEAYASLSKEEPIFVSSLSRETIAGYALFEDVYGNPILILRIDLPRDNYAQGVTGVVYFVFALAVVGAIFAVVTMLLLEKFVLSRLSRLNKDVQSIGKKPDFVARVSVAGKDELSDLGGEINKMLSRLAHTEENLKEERDKAQEYLGIAGVMIVALDANGKITLLNQKGVEILECSGEDVLGKNWIDTFIPVRNRHQISEIFQFLMNGKLVSESFLGYNESLVLTLSGKERLIAWHNVVIRDSSGQIIGTLSSGTDITELKQAEKALFESELRFRRITENMLDIVSQTDMSGIFHYISPSSKRVLGYAPEGMLKKSIYDFMHPDDVVKVTKVIQESINACLWGKMEFRYRHADGHYLWLETIGNFICDDKGKPVGAVFNSRDATERKRMETKLLHTTKRLETLLTTAREGIITGDSEENITFTNKAFADIVGYEDNELVGKNLKQLLDEEGFRKIKEETEVRKKGETSRYELTFYRKNGEHRIVQVSASPLWNEDGSFAGSLGIAMDVTEQKLLEQTLKDNETRLRRITDNMIDIIGQIDMAGVFNYVSQSIKRTLGYEPNELLGKTIYDFLHPDDLRKVTEAIQTAIHTFVFEKTEFRYRHSNGHYLWLECAGNFVPDEKGQIIGFVLSSHDITERKRMDDILRESQQKFERLFNSNPEASAFVDVNDCVLDINPRFSELFGYSQDDARGKPLDDLIVPENKRDEGKMLTEESMAGYIYRETVRRAKDGSLIPVMISAAPITTGNQPIGCVVSYRDITESKRMEEKIRESEERLRQLIEYAPDAIYTNDLNGNFLDGNRQAEDMTGYTKEELVGKNMLHLGILPQKYVPKAIEALEKNLRGEKTGPEEFEFVRKDGNIIIVEISTFPVRRGGNVEILGIARDVTERKNMEEVLRDSEEKFRAISTSAKDGIILVNSEGKVSFWNPAAEKIFGYVQEEAVGKEAHYLLVPQRFQEDMAKAIQKFMETGGGDYVGRTVEIVANKKDGKEFPLELSLSALQMKGKWHTVGIARDITERKQMMRKLEEYSQQLETLVEKRTQQLKEAQEQLIKSERLAAIGQVAAMVGHDLRNPLTGIKGAAYYLKTRLVPKMDAKSKEMVELIEKDVEYSNKIITDLMDYSREIRLEFSKTSPKSIMNETLSVVQVPESVKVLDLTQDSIQITLDIDKMKRVFANLTKNAIDAMPRGGKITISNRESGGNVEFIFNDTGTGIAKEIVEKIWTPFFTTKAKGMGLGLAICKRVIEAHGGRISVESIVGEGTTFTIILPIEPKTKENGGEKVWVNLPESLLSTTTKASEKS